MSSTEHTCKHCHLHYSLGETHSTFSYCGMCNTPTLVAVAFDSQNYEQPAVFTQALKAANNFFAKYGIDAAMIKFPPVVTHVAYVFDGFNTEVYTLTYHIEVPAYVAKQIREARDA